MRYIAATPRRNAGILPAARAMTFVELTVAMLVLSIIGVSVCTLTFAAMDGDRILRSANTSQSEVDFAIRRITNNIRECQTSKLTVGTSTLSTLTQADGADGYPNGATVAYSLAADATTPSQNDLVENDQRYGTNVLVHNVTTFNAVAVSGTTGLYQIDIVTAGSAPADRHVKIFTRN